ncbi:hypothetical protein [Oceaniovalibus sp. ACAM 378]|uniref:hypothetical protein n=1 Tax=Oceaniovalibus sp. ACAM 378 TaxID=2599923 RepID=UPI0011DA1DB9|nr:hypothetical protein [Oceaniovalibus sp. ACAM 378]TYB85533.1 hypothetical protein FQ320_18620 [Oceaniovalibus sp. ACAM 378]
MALDNITTTEAAMSPDRSIDIQVFMSRSFKIGSFEYTPKCMLRDPVEDIGLGDVAEIWIEEIIESDDPDFEFCNLIDHLSGLLANVKLLRKHYQKFIEQKDALAHTTCAQSETLTIKEEV